MKNKSLRFLIAFLISAALHGTGVTLLARSSAFSPLPKFPLHQKADNPVSLEFVPSPERVAEKKPMAPTKIISEKSTAAQNPIAKPDLPKGHPYQQGILEHDALERAEAPKTQVEKVSSTPPEEAALTPKEKVTAIAEDALTLQKISPPQRKVQKKESRQKKKETPSKSKENKTQRSSKKEEHPSPAKKNLTTIADILDEAGYNAQSDAVARYFSKEFKKISSVWRLELYSAKDFANSFSINLKKTVVIFCVMPDGQVRDLQVVEHEGDEFAMRYPVQAIEKTAPFTPLPQDVLSYIRTEGLWVRIEFNYISKDKNGN